tara:strand:+ start:1370 stop:1855 length:486 start_codon:yes stop_codon:yes gene_type:complete
VDRFKSLICGRINTYDAGGGTESLLYEVPEAASTAVGGVTTSPKAVSSHVQTIVTSITICNEKSAIDTSSFAYITTPGFAEFDIKTTTDLPSSGSPAALIANDVRLYASETYSFDSPIFLYPGDELEVVVKNVTVSANAVDVSVLVSGIEVFYGYGPSEES